MASGAGDTSLADIALHGEVLVKANTTPNGVGVVLLKSKTELYPRMHVFAECCSSGLERSEPNISSTGGGPFIWVCWCGALKVSLKFGFVENNISVNSGEDSSRVILNESTLAHWVELWTGCEDVELKVTKRHGGAE